MGGLNKINVGQARFALFQVGIVSMKVSEIVREGTELPHGLTYDSVMKLPINNGLIGLGDARIVVDPCDYEALCPSGSPSRPTGYAVPPPLVSQLSGMSVKPEDITHVVLTHFHHDHCNGSTAKGDDGEYHPTFPRATYYLGASDWNYSVVQAELKSDPSSINSLGVLQKSGVLTLVDAPLQVVPGVTIIPTPGESPGHQIIRVTSGGETLYCIGDLFHDPMDVADPRIMADWNDPEVNLKSRNSFLDRISREDCVISAGHMPLGRIGKTRSGYEWSQTVQS